MIHVIAANEGRNAVSPHLEKLLPSLVASGESVEFVGWDRNRRHPRNQDSPGIAYRMLFCGGGYGSAVIALLTPLWVLTATLWLRFRRPDSRWYALDLDGALPIALSQLLGGRQTYVYSVRDNFDLRRAYPASLTRLIQMIDRFVIRRAALVIYPDEVRIPDYASTDSVRVLPNAAPDLGPHTPIPLDRSELVVGLFGQLWPSRGVELVIDIASSLTSVSFIVAGVADAATADALSELENVDFRGRVATRDALEMLREVDVSLTLYAPTSKINILAASNKWSDAQMAARPVVVNSELRKAPSIVAAGVGFSCPYEPLALAELLTALSRRRDELRAAGVRARQLFESTPTWEDVVMEIQTSLKCL